MDDLWQEHLEHEPGMAPYLAVLAQRFVRTGVAPRSLTLGAAPEDPQVRRALAFLFGGGVVKDSKLVVKLPERLRSPASLQALASRLRIAATPDADAPVAAALATAVLRQGLIYPQFVPLLAALKASDDLMRLFRTRADAERCLHGLLGAVERLEIAHAAITLSQLGADVLNDSKALRSGALRKLLVRMLARVAEDDDADPAQILSRFGVVENPYTTLALVYGPVIYEDAAGRAWDWPARLHAAGQAAALTWEQVQGMRALRPAAPVAGVITSENAAPFHQLVEARSPLICVYTEGYPNSSVSRVLELLAQSGLRARHWGDSDLDGLRIAACVARVIPVELHAQEHAILAKLRERLIPLTQAQRERASAYLAAHPEFRFREQLAQTVEHGWLEQEQTVSS